MDEELILVLAFVFITGIGFILVIMGKAWKAPQYTFLAGMIFIFGSVTTYAELGIGWIILGIGFGAMLMIEGGMALDAPET